MQLQLAPCIDAAQTKPANHWDFSANIRLFYTKAHLDSDSRFDSTETLLLTERKRTQVESNERAGVPAAAVSIRFFFLKTIASKKLFLSKAAFTDKFQQFSLQFWTIIFSICIKQIVVHFSFSRARFLLQSQRMPVEFDVLIK